VVVVVVVTAVVPDDKPLCDAVAEAPPPQPVSAAAIDAA
jgi:hypothetical protein